MEKTFYKKLIFVDDNSVELARMAFLLTFLKKQGLNISAEYYLFKDNHNEKKADVADKSKKSLLLQATMTIVLRSSSRLSEVFIKKSK